jgi:hypothetical protein
MNKCSPNPNPNMNSWRAEPNTEHPNAEHRTRAWLHPEPAFTCGATEHRTKHNTKSRTLNKTSKGPKAEHVQTRMGQPYTFRIERRTKHRTRTTVFERPNAVRVQPWLQLREEGRFDWQLMRRQINARWGSSQGLKFH